MKRYETKSDAVNDVADRHGVTAQDIDMIPHPKDDVQATFLSYGPGDDDVELVAWDEDED